MRKITLEVKWCKKENDFVVIYPRKSDGGYVIDHVVGKRSKAQDANLDLNLWESEKFSYRHKGYNFIEHDFVKEMERRGYDKTTLSFKIQILPSKLQTDFPHIYEVLTKEEKKKLGIK